MQLQLSVSNGATRSRSGAVVAALWWLAVAFLATAPAASAQELPGTPLETAMPRGEGEPLRVLVAVLPFRVYAAEPRADLELSLTELLVSRLEATGGVSVVHSVTLREYSAGGGALASDTSLRELARRVGADYVVAGSLTELAGRFSIDVRITPVGEAIPSDTVALTAEDEDQLLERVGELVDLVLDRMGVAPPEERIAAVRFEGVPEQPGMRGLITVRRDDIYDRDTARADAERLQDIPGVASATFRTERNDEGLVLIYRIIPETELPPDTALARSDETDRIADVAVTGNRRIESSAIVARLDTQPGGTYSPRDIAADVRSIFELGFFRDVKVTSDESLDGRIVTFAVEEHPVVRQVSVTGNDSIDGDEIRDALTLTTGSSLDYPVLLENRDRISSLYRAGGYYLAQVDYQVEELAADAVGINFEIVEGKKLKLREIRFEGNEHFDDDELMLGLKTRPWRWHSLATQYLDHAGTYAEPVFLQDLQDITDRYQNAGFLKVEVPEPVIEPGEKGLAAVVKISEGKRYKVGEVDVEGDETMDLDALRQIIGLEEGEFFNRAMLTGDVERLERHYTDRGFYFAKVEPRTDISDEDLAVGVDFKVEKGPLYFIRRVDIAGNTITHDPIIRREIAVVEGQLYSARSVAISRSRVRRLGYFEEVNFEPLQTDEADQLDLSVRVVERPTGSLSFGAGFSSQDSFVLNGSIAQTNLFGKGYGASLSADLGSRTDRFFLSFTDPYFLGSTFSMTTRLFSTDIEFSDFKQESQGLELTFGHALNARKNSRGFLRYSYSNRDIDIDNSFASAAVILREIVTDAQDTSMAGLIYSSDTRNDRISPTNGRILRGSLEVAGLGGFSKFTRAEGTALFFRRLPRWVPAWFPLRDRSSFSYGASFGWINPFNSLSDFDFEVTDID
ncbi:MAG: outer membrane protein assembly factor BamA, partial [Myxococcales bacterium]|nr:outer membrane protein assembly factor BamA [Myxococcales bacterium]